MVRYYILALTLLLIAFGSPVRLVGDEGPPCSGSGVYKPLTLYRKVQLATAYFVNPALPDKAKIVDVYTLKLESVSADERQELIKNLGEQIKTGEIKLMVPVQKDDTTTLTSVGCVTRSKEPSAVDAKEFFSGLLEKLKQEKGVVYLSPQQGKALPDFQLPTKDGSFVSWDPGQSVKLGNWPQKSAPENAL